MSSELGQSLLCCFCTLLYQCKLTSLLLLDLELSVALANDPSIVQLPARSHLMEEWHEIPFVLADAGSVVAELVNTAIVETVWNP